MKITRIFCTISFFLLFSHLTLIAQTDTVLFAKDSAVLQVGVTSVIKDPRIDILGKKMAEFNEAIANAPRRARGYRLMLLSTSDRDAAMRLRSQLLQQYPDQKVYMTFQSPYIKLKFGDYLDKADAEKIRKQIQSQNLVNTNIYILSEMIEVKPEKNPEEE